MTETCKIVPLLGNSQKLDGGAMFGNAPKAMWSKWVEVDSENRVQLATRAMLVIEKDRKILFETGIGAFFPPKLKDRFGVIENEHILLESLKAHDLSHQDIDIVVLSHLHFDHAGGLLTPWAENKDPELLFPNATYICSKKGYDRALNPHARDRASYIPQLMTLLEASGRVHLEEGSHSEILGDNYVFHYSDGHTPGLLMTEVKHANPKALFISDLIPGTPWVHLPVTMGYDRAPELLIDEKQHMLEHVIKNEVALFFTHDREVALATIGKNEKGRYSSAPI